MLTPPPEKERRAVEHQGDDDGTGDTAQGPGCDDARGKIEEGLGEEQSHRPDGEQNFRGEIRNVGIREHGLPG